MPSRRELANAVRALAMDAVQRANSGHPGACMGMADMAEVLWNDFMVHNPANPKWWNRDRFVLSNGHASMLLYSVLHLSGYDVSIDDLKNFRQFDSITPGHPEHGLTPGVEISTGPLGQGIASAVGMALAEKMLASRYNREGYDIVDHFTYVFLGDGCLMEGVSHEASSLAGTLGLGKLICLWDSNGISIEGNVEGWFSEDVLARYKAYGWHVEEADGLDGESVKKAIAKARKVLDKPSLIACKTEIGFGSPNKAGKASSHGSPLGEEELAAAKKQLGWKYSPFEIPAAIKSEWDARLSGQQAEKKWNKLYDEYKKAFPKEAREFELRMLGESESNWLEPLLELAGKCQEEGGQEATRNTSKQVLDIIGPLMPELVGGSADLSGSVCTRWKGCEDITHDSFTGNYINYGVREFAMACMLNGLVLHGGFLPYAGTFMVFTDYARGALRLASIMELQQIWVMTHDSIGVGEDGATHQPVEQMAALRVMPNISVWRPCDKVEAIAAWIDGLRCKSCPSCLVMSRQNLPIQPRDKTVFYEVKNQVQAPTQAQTIVQTIRQGGYILRECSGSADPDVILIATGSEVALAVDAAKQLEDKKIRTRVVSMPCSEVFDMQDAGWRSKVLPASVRKRVAIEAGSKDVWYKYVGLEGKVIGMSGYGKSAPAKTLFNHYGFTVEKVIKTVEDMMNE